MKTTTLSASRIKRIHDLSQRIYDLSLILKWALQTRVKYYIYVFQNKTQIGNACTSQTFPRQNKFRGKKCLQNPQHKHK